MEKLRATWPIAKGVEEDSDTRAISQSLSIHFRRLSAFILSAAWKHWHKPFVERELRPKFFCAYVFLWITAAPKTEFISDNAIHCTAPMQDYGEYSVTVSNNGIDLEGSWDGVSFAYVPLPIVANNDVE